MAKWTITALILMTSWSFCKTMCTKGRSVLHGEQITCANVTASFFRNYNLTLGKSHWFACENCDINVIDEKTLANVSKRNNVSYLIWSHNNLRAVRNNSFARFPLLKVLILRDNIIESLHLKCFHGIKRLVQLDLSNNLISVLYDDLFSDLENLDLLNLTHNEIYVINLSAFRGLKNLKYLYLDHNNLDKLEANVFKHLLSLKILYIQNNRLISIHPLAFANLANLNYLYMNNNSINHLEQYNFKALGNLIDLQMRHNDLEDITTSSFNGLKNLERLHLGGNKISSVRPYGFVGLNSLEKLDLIGNNFDHFTLDYLKDMERLQELWLEGNQISNFSISFKVEDKNFLRAVSFKDNNLTFINYKLLYKKAPSLKELFISGNPWTCQFVANMYNYFINNSVLLCANNNCSVEATEDLIDEACKPYYLNVTEAVDFGDDFSTDKVGFLKSECILLILSINIAALLR